MWYQTEQPDYGTGLELMRREYQTALSELKTVSGFTEIERLHLRKELVDTYLLQLAQERKAIIAQILDDREAALKRS